MSKKLTKEFLKTVVSTCLCIFQEVWK